eukprot:scaffold200592_cov51-Prasinocladus_malaysianus.AAC.2
MECLRKLSKSLSGEGHVGLHQRFAAQPQQDNSHQGWQEPCLSKQDHSHQRAVNNDDLEVVLVRLEYVGSLHMATSGVQPNIVIYIHRRALNSGRNFSFIATSQLLPILCNSVNCLSKPAISSNAQGKIACQLLDEAKAKPHAFGQQHYARHLMGEAESCKVRAAFVAIATN